jgi:hypothetical protein
MEPQALKSEVPQGIEKHHHNSGREKYEDDHPNNDTRDRSQSDRYDKGYQQASSNKSDDGEEDAENVSTPCLCWFQYDMRK